ncbi:hypothetical protein [Streptomyces sp. A0592]|uniref:hypothetical protein n=1 Tax=Streptomyces sp. A0592 TaxID=2563099 RepID=UPI00109E475C|nr:hypothetical protein [Streptomyces sp. A0592]THA86365.1 hypothetical protein E6U81_05175 [Streptomyces sp. A0592]
MSTVIPVPDNWGDRFSSWEELRHGYHAGDRDAAVRDCARRLDATAAGPEDGPVLYWTLGLLMLAPYVAFGNPGPGVEDEVTSVLRRIARGDDGRACPHGWHPYDADADDVLEHLPACLEVLGSPLDRALNGLLPENLLPAASLDEPEDDEAEPANLSGPEILDRWQCPRTAPGFARAALDYLGATVH